MFLSDNLIFNKSIIYFSRNRDIETCWDSIKNTDELLKLVCYLKPLQSSSMDNELDYIRYETRFKGYATDPLNFREYVNPFSVGYGVVNNQTMKLQLLPTYDSPNSNILYELVGTKIELKVLEPLLMIDL